MKILLASRNRDKAREVREKVRDLPIEIVTPYDFSELPDIEEDGETLEENAIKKATELYRLTGLPTIADDSGLEVDVLGGAPGVYSARYDGPDATYTSNVAKVIREMQNVQPNQRQAQFRCVIAYVETNEVHKFIGEVVGIITEYPRGEDGFGYDPIFYIPEKGKTLAEMSVIEKNQISHRGKALDAWVEYMRQQNDIA
jgi:XTP/dITP diphosphohydrolase